MSGWIEHGAPCLITSIGVGERKFSGTEPYVGVRALCGVATRFNKVHRHKGRLEVFSPGCFAKALVDQSTIRFLIGHDEGKCIATTNGGGLKLASDDVSLTFALEAPRTELADILLREVKSGARVNMSVGYDSVEYVDRTYDGETVRFVTAARLSEISAVTTGAVKGAYVELANANDGPPQLTKASADVGAAFAEWKKAYGALQKAIGI